MDRGYFTFSSVKDPQKYLGFMRNGRPINYSNLKHDEKCRLIFKKEISRDSSNDVASVTSPIIYQETSTTMPRKSSRMQKTHSNRIDSSKPSRNNKPKTHSVRHRHNELPLRHSHPQHNNNNNNFNINNNLNNVNLVKDRINSDSNNNNNNNYNINNNNNNDHDPYNNSVVNISDNNPHHVRHHHGQNHQRPIVDDEIDGGTPCDDMTGVNVVKGNKANNKKNVKKCNNRRNKKNNENAVRHTRKKSSHKQSANRTPEN